ncbi:7-cyano-7-deazaguanine synthase [Actinophytocola sp.]|uniref:7-cyano-7-deazaguanine synthase n=1 Tax=Actinophytocola sp. TaxID=1872138 RepID=UPI003D6A27DA
MSRGADQGHLPTLRVHHQQRRRRRPRHQPLLNRTKGEVCQLALQSGLTGHVLGRTISCGNPRRTRMKADFNCGYCYPCLLRRAGLIHALGDDPTPYRHHVADLPLDDGKPET